MGKSYRRLKEENRSLRAQLHNAKREAVAVAETFVLKHNVKPGDLIVFRTDNLGTNFGFGVSALQNMERQIGEVAGGKVLTMATRTQFTVENLTAKDQTSLRAALDKLDELRKQGALAPPSERYMGCGHLATLKLVDGRCGPCTYNQRTAEERERRLREQFEATRCKAIHASGAVCDKQKGHTDGWHESNSGRKWYIPSEVMGGIIGKLLRGELDNAAESFERTPPAEPPPEPKPAVQTTSNEVYRFCFYCGGKMKATSAGAFQRIICESCVSKGRLRDHAKGT